MTVSNTTGYTQMLEPHTKLGSAVQCYEVPPIQQHPDYQQTTEMPAVVQKITTQKATLEKIAAQDVGG